MFQIDFFHRWSVIRTFGLAGSVTIAILISCFVTAKAVADTPPGTPAPKHVSPDRLNGIWHNQLSSQMELKYDPTTNTLSGTYENHAAPAQPPYKKIPLSGTVNGDVVSWTVNWGEELGSITAWVGHVYVKDGTLEIHTMWHLARPVPSPDKVWMGVLDGSDVFNPGPLQ